MNFIEAMNMAGTNGIGQSRPPRAVACPAMGSAFVYYDPYVRFTDNKPFGFWITNFASDRGKPYVPTLDEINATDWQEVTPR